MIWICATCAVETDDLPEPPGPCAVCEDERQWVPADGQRWTTLRQARAAGTRITVEEVETDLWGLRAEPEVGIGQQTMVVRVPEGVLLFDCVGYIDDAAVEPGALSRADAGRGGEPSAHVRRADGVGPRPRRRAGARGRARRRVGAAAGPARRGSTTSSAGSHRD